MESAKKFILIFLPPANTLWYQAISELKLIPNLAFPSPNKTSMYISVSQSHALDQIIKCFEVALRSFIADNLITSFPTPQTLSTALSAIALPPGVVYGRRFESKVRFFLREMGKIYPVIKRCAHAIETRKFDNDVPYVSELIDFLLIFFNDIFSHANITRGFSTVEEFHYCCSVFHQTRNSLSHPASRPTVAADAVKVVYFVNNIISTLEQKYFWYCSKETLEGYIRAFNETSSSNVLKAQNLEFAGSSYKQLLCRDRELGQLYSAIIGTGETQRLAGSVALYGYGGVGKTALTTDFLYRIMRDKKDGLHKDIEFLLFFSSKDEYLRSSSSSGELYIDDVRPQFSTLIELKSLICTILSIPSINDLSIFKRGIIVIDNIENIPAEEKSKIISFIKSLPRSIQFIVTSRSEELCEEKIHLIMSPSPTSPVSTERDKAVFV